MKFNYLIPLSFFWLASSNAQQPLLNTRSPATLQQNYGNSSPVPISIDPAIALDAMNDTLHSQSILSAINGVGPDKGVNTRSVRDAALFKTISPSVVLITTNDGLGTGTIIDSSGLIYFFITVA